MRDFRDAKLMARALRDALHAKAVETTHSECLELIAKAFGTENWNVLAAKIEEARSPAGAGATPQTPSCTFCGKSAQEVKTLVAGPSSTFICDECVEVCNDVVDDQDDRSLLGAIAADETAGSAGYHQLSAMTTADVASFAERRARWAERHRLGLQEIVRALAIKDGEAEPDHRGPPVRATMLDRSKADLRDLQRALERALKEQEQAQRLAARVLAERKDE